MNDDKSSSTGTILLAFAGGALLGAGLGVLFAPQSGRKTRRQISGMADDAEDYARDAAHDAVVGLKKAEQKGEKWLEQIKETVEDKKAQVSAAMDGTRR